MSNNKMKGLLKGLRYISQIFDADEKEPEIEIGFPTDVKHIAHIGWDGPSVNSPNWMNEFKGQPGIASSSANGETKEDPAFEEQSRRSTGSGSGPIPSSPGAMPNSPRRASTSLARDLPELPKSSRRHSTSAGDSPTKAKSDRAKQTRRSSKSSSKDNVDGANKPTRHHKDSSQPSSNLPDIPKKTRRKKSNGEGGGSTSKSSRDRARALEGDDGSMSESLSQRGRRRASALSADETELGCIS